MTLQIRASATIEQDRGVGGPEGEKSNTAQTVQSGEASGVGRDSWCTPKWLADALGEWDLDPCSNPRSHIRARKRYWPQAGKDGLVLAPEVPSDVRAFINPPYSRGQVMRWVEAYKHTRFCFLLRLDSSTRWFHKLYAHCDVVLLPMQRVNFEPPPGVIASSNPFPHALFFKNRWDVTDGVYELCYGLRGLP